METGYKAFRTDVLRSLRLREDDFGIEPEITGEICKRKLRIYELPISYYGRTYDEGKKIGWRDGIKAIRVLLRVRLTSAGTSSARGSSRARALIGPRETLRPESNDNGNGRAAPKKTPSASTFRFDGPEERGRHGVDRVDSRIAKHA
jgi:hypothetical protein